ncbi:Uncharacterised protein [Enterobacter hormaechei]|nr:Uncharacterised protein [Enterobacter hormaechei]
MVSGQDQNVIFSHQLHQLWQTAVKQLQTRSITGDVATVAPGGVEVHEVGEDNGLIARFFHLFDGGVEQRIQTGRFDLFGNAAVGVNVRDFTHGNHVTVFLVDEFLQHGRRRWLHGQIVTVAGTLEVTRFVADKRTRDNAANVVAAFGQLFTGDFAQLVQFIQAKRLFMAGDLENGVSRGIENRLAGFHVLFAELVQNHGTGRVAVTEVARQVGALHQLIKQLLREAVLVIGEVTPVEQHRHAGDFPVAGRSIFTGRELVRPRVGAHHFRVTVHTGCDLTGRAFMRFYQPQTGQVWQVQRAFTTVVRFAFCTGFRDVTQGIGTHVTKSFCIFGCADAE